MAKLRYVIITMVLCLALVLSGCKAIIDKQNATEPPTEAVADEAPVSGAGYDNTSPKSAEWFDNAVFVGDSVTLKLSYYCADHPEALGKTEFFCAGSLGYTNALWDIDDPEAVHPYYQGEVHLTEECAELTGKPNVFIMLGMNDIGLYGVNDTMNSCKELVQHILQRTPNARIYIQSVTPMIAEMQMDHFNNSLIKEFNGMLKAYCEQNGYRYLDVFSALADSEGNLPLEYCSDPDNMGLHFNDTSCQIWADYLKKNA